MQPVNCELSHNNQSRIIRSLNKNGLIRTATTSYNCTVGISRRFFFFFGGGVLANDPSQGTPKTKNSTDLGHYILGEGPKFTFKNIKQRKIICLATGQGRKPNHKKTRQKLIFFMKKQICVLIYESCFKSILYP